jgi:hypothetical protein
MYERAIALAQKAANDGSLDAAAKQRAAQALGDAQLNLAKLPR